MVAFFAVPSPESKLLCFYVATPVLAAGLWWFAWSMPPRAIVHWLCSVTSLLFLGFAASKSTKVLAKYLIDTHTTYAASTLVPCCTMRANDVHMKRSFPNDWRRLVYRPWSGRSSKFVGHFSHNFLYNPLNVLQVGKKDPRVELLCGKDCRGGDGK